MSQLASKITLILTAATQLESMDARRHTAGIVVHCLIEGPTSILQLFWPLLLFPHLAENDDAILMCRGVGAGLFCLSILAWRTWRLHSAVVVQSTMLQSLCMYHALAFFIVFLTKTVHGTAGPMELLSNAVHAVLVLLFL